MKSIKEIEVRYSETDQMGVVYHSNYLVWMEIGRTSFIKDLGFNMMDFERDGFLFPVYEMDIKFISPTRYDEKIYVETSIHKLSKVKMIYEQRVLNDKNEEKIRAIVTIVCVTKDDFKITRFDRELKEFYDKCLNFLED